MIRFKYLIVLAGCTALGLLILEYGVLPRLENRSDAPAVELNSAAWVRDNRLIDENVIRFKNVITKDDWTWHSAGNPVSVERHTAKRIMVISDSWVWGDGYANMNDIWWRQLARELRRRGYADVEVLGVGKCGASTHDELDQLRRVVPKYRPDLVIMGYVSNDADEHRVPVFDYKRLDGDPVVRFHQGLIDAGILPRLNFQLIQLRRQRILKTVAGERRGWSYPDWEMKLVGPDNLKIYRGTLRDLAAFVRQSGVPFFVLTTPMSPTRSVWGPLYAPVQPLFDEYGLRFHNILDNFAREFAGRRRPPHLLNWNINPANGHPGTFSTHYYALEAANILERDYPFALGPRTPCPAAYAPEINDWMPANLAITRRRPGLIEFKYPLPGDEWMLRMPVGRPHVMLALAMPVQARVLRVSGPDLSGAQLYLTAIDRKFHCDRGMPAVLPRRDGRDLVWNLDRAAGADLNTVRLVADFTGPDRSVTLQIIE